MVDFHCKRRRSKTYEIRVSVVDHFNEVIEMMLKHYLPQEPMSKVTKIIEDPDSVQDIVDIWKKSHDQ